MYRLQQLDYAVCAGMRVAQSTAAPTPASTRSITPHRVDCQGVAQGRWQGGVWPTHCANGQHPLVETGAVRSAGPPESCRPRPPCRPYGQGLGLWRSTDLLRCSSHAPLVPEGEAQMGWGWWPAGGGARASAVVPGTARCSRSSSLVL